MIALMLMCLFYWGRAAPVDLKVRFNETLLVVRWGITVPLNSTSWDPLVWHHEIYGQYFRDQVIYVPWSLDEWSNFQRENNGTRRVPGQFVPMGEIDPSSDGIAAYRLLVHAIHSFPNYLEYLYKQDDIALDLSRLAELDPGAVWQQEYKVYQLGRQFADMYKVKNAEWWKSVNGVPGLKKAMAAGKREFKQKIKTCMGTKYGWAAGRAEVLHVPWTEIYDFRTSMKAFSAGTVYREIAIATFAHCLAFTNATISTRFLGPTAAGKCRTAMACYPISPLLGKSAMSVYIK